LILIVVIALQFPQTQRYLTHKAASYLSDKIKTKVEVGEINVSFPKSIHLKDVFVEDQQKDTLLFSHSLKIDLNLLDLIAHKVTVNLIDIERLTAHISRPGTDSLFNFSFIPAAFSSPQAVAKPSSVPGKPWVISLGGIHLKNIYFTWKDQPGGTTADIRLGELQTRLDVFNLPGKKIHFRSIKLDNTRASVHLDPVAKKEVATDPSTPFDLGLSKLELHNIVAYYGNSGDGKNLDITLGDLFLKADEINLPKQILSLDQVKLTATTIKLTSGKAQVSMPEQAITNQDTKSGWVISLKHLYLDSNKFVLNDSEQVPKAKGIDYAHLALSDIGITGSDIHIAPGSVMLNLDRLQLNERSGLSIRKFSSHITYDSTHVELANLNLETDKSRIGKYLSVSYPSLKVLKENPNKLFMHADLDTTTISMDDVLIFQPDLLKKAKLKSTAIPEIHLSTKLNGTLDDLRIERFVLNTQRLTTINFTGMLKGLQKPESMYADLQVREFSTGARDVQAILEASMLPKAIQIPALITAKGNFKGYVKNFDAGVDLKTSIGAASASVKMNPRAGNKEQAYAMNLHVRDFDLGSLLKQKGTLGPVTLTASIVGQGLDTTTLKAHVNVCMDSAFLKGYVYKDFTLDGKLEKKSFLGTAHINDQNLAFDLDANIDVGNVHPHYIGKLNLKGADLGALHLSKEDLRISTVVISDLEGGNGRNITGKVRLVNGLIIKDNIRHPVDSIVLESKYTKEMANINLQSSIVTADFRGNIILDQLPALLDRHLDSYFNRGKNDTVMKLDPQKFNFSINLINGTLLTDLLIPDLKKLSPFTSKGVYDSEAKVIQFDLGIPQIQYTDILLDSLKFKIRSNPETLNYSLSLANIADSLFLIENFSVNGTARDNRLAFNISSSKNDSSRLIEIGGVLKAKGENLELRLNESLILNMTTWKVDSGNYLLFGNREFNAHKLFITDGEQALSIHSEDQTEHTPLEIEFKAFDLAPISRIFENDKELVSGSLDGKIIIKDQNAKSAFSSDIDLKDFAFMGNPFGTIHLHTDNEQAANQYAVKLKIDGNENDLAMDGYYSSGVEDNNLNFKLDVKRLNLSSVEPFLFGQLTRMSGGMNGTLTITGKASSPNIGGSLQLKDCFMKPKIIDSYLSVPDGKIVFASKKVRLNSFTLIDSLHNKAVLSGYADIADLSNINFDLKLKTNNFLALNTNRNDNSLYFGHVFLDSDLRLRGTMDQPVIDAKIRLNKGTSITYVKPVDEGVVEEGKGVVEFTNHFKDQNDIMARKEIVVTKKNGVTGLEFNAVIDIDKTTKLKMIVDPVSGDSLIAIGAAQLIFSLDPNGKTTLSGRYKLYDGSYHLAINDLIKRDFKIQSGSIITWSGDVMDAYLNLTAIYTVRTSPLDLVQDQLAGMSEAQKNAFRQNMDFKVYLKMSGSLATPEISFDIRIPQNQTGAMNGMVAVKLDQLRTDENEMNKQVFALLAINRFLAADPLDNSGSSTSISSSARSSASKLLTDRLNSLSSQYIKGVDLNLGVQSFDDYSSGQDQGRTQLQVALSKHLFQDKVTVKVGGNVDVEGEKAKQNNASDIAGNIDIEYKLTSDETYKLQGFRKNEYLNPIEGEVTKTGVGVIFTKDFNKLMDLFRKGKKTEATVE
jgi:translocation and assembly module TamB